MHKTDVTVDYAHGNKKGTTMRKNIFQDKLNESLSKFKDKTAIEYAGRLKTYTELDRRSDAVARFLVNKGIKEQTFIGLLMNDRMELIVTIIGIMKAGGVIVPLYPAYPDARIEAMICSTDIRYLFIDPVNYRRVANGGINLPEDREFFFVCEKSGIKTVFDSENGCAAFSESMDKPEVRVNPEDVLYIHFTSGTTGTPKAVLGKNKSLLHFIQWEIETFAADNPFRVAQFTIPGFDPFLRDVFAPLLAGGVVCIPEEEEILQEPRQLVVWLDKYKISLIHCVSSLFRLLSADSLAPTNFKALKYILLAGEKITPADLVYWYDVFDERIQLVNCYGPTETTMSKVYYLIRKADTKRDRIPIGKPIKGGRIIILDEESNICGPLDTGEIYIRTPFRSCGYYNDLQLNKEKFIPNPFNNDPDDILYKSGDLGRFLLDGNIDIIGRVDRQVKIRGYRIELEEIESVLMEHPSIKEAVVVKKETSAPGTPGYNEILCGYIVITQAEEDEVLAEEEAFNSRVKEYLSGKLPDYMVPAYIERIDRIPRGATGKVNFKVLPDPFRARQGVFTAPRSDIEEKIARIWSEILGVEKIGIKDSFIGLGGNSLNILTLIAKIHREFAVKVTLGQIFKNNTVEKQAKIIEAAAKEEYTAIEASEEREFYELSYNQKRLWIINQLEPRSSSYNIVRRIELREEAAEEVIKAVLYKILSRHEGFRTGFRLVDEKLAQFVKQYVEIPFRMMDISSFPDEKKAQERARIFDEVRVSSFDLSKPPLSRVVLLKLSAREYDLIFNIHHIIADGMSMEILRKDFFSLYDGYMSGKRVEPGSLKFRYRDFAEWQNKQLRNPGLKEKSHLYWQKKLSEGLPELELPRDVSSPAGNADRQSALCGFVIDNDVRDKLNKLAQRLDTSLFIVLFAGFNMILSWAAGQKEIVCGIVSAGRDQEGLQDIVGFFVNTLLLRNRIDYKEGFKDFLERVKNVTIEALQHQDYPLELVLDDLGMKFPDITVMFNMLNMQEAVEEQLLNPGELYYLGEVEDVKFDVVVHIVEHKNGINIQCQYKKRLYKRKRIVYMMEQYLSLLGNIAVDPGKTVRDYFPGKQTRKLALG